MTKKNKIYLTAITLSLLIFFIDLAIKQLSYSPNQEFDRTTLETQLPALTTQLQETLKNDENNSAILSKLDLAWNPNPFQKPQEMQEDVSEEDDNDEIIEEKIPIRRKVMRKKAIEKKTTIPTPSFRYTGFIDMGTSQVALINGNQYVVGDTLSIYKVETISAKMVLLRSLETNEILSLQLSQ